MKITKQDRENIYFLMKIRNQTFLKSTVKITLITKFLHIISWFVLYSSVTGFLLFNWKCCGGRLLLSFSLLKIGKKKKIKSNSAAWNFLFILFKKSTTTILICWKSNSINHILLQDLLSDKGGLLKNYFLVICWRNSVFQVYCLHILLYFQWNV